MSTIRRKVCVVLTDRANYGRLKPVMAAIRGHAGLELQVLSGGTMSSERHGRPVDLVRADGFHVDGEVASDVEGATPLSMAHSVGLGVRVFADELHRLSPHIVLLVGDRFGTLSAALAAAYLNLCIVHLQGGEVSGSIDESARHCISKLAHFHYPATQRAADTLVRMGERKDTILGIGCPSSDLVTQLAHTAPGQSRRGKEAKGEFLLLVFHPVTTEYHETREQLRAILSAIDDLSIKTIALAPNVDAGANEILREFADKSKTPGDLTLISNLPPEEYLDLLARCSCAIGNSSSFIREGSLLGTPAVVVGTRQQSREHGENVLFAEPLREHILAAIRSQLRHGRFAPNSIYGDGAGTVASRITQALLNLEPYAQKRLDFTTS
ncbi:MAG: UDP-N-acetylglucosamine 2-epimerase [Archangium sp.]